MSEKPQTTSVTAGKLPRGEAEKIVLKNVPFLAPLDAFLGYCSAHSATPLALFNGVQIGTLQILAGYKDTGEEWVQHPDYWRSVDLSDLVAEARSNIEATT